MIEAEVGMMPLLEGSASQGRQQPFKAAKGREQILPLSLRKERSPAITLTLAPWDPFQTSGQQNCKRINLRCFKPWRLW